MTQTIKTRLVINLVAELSCDHYGNMEQLEVSSISSSSYMTYMLVDTGHVDHVGHVGHAAHVCPPTFAQHCQIYQLDVPGQSVVSASNHSLDRVGYRMVPGYV